MKMLKFLIMDEADRILNMDFEQEVDKILRAIPRERKTYLFSATMTAKGKNYDFVTNMLGTVILKAGVTYIEQIFFEIEKLQISQQVHLITRCDGYVTHVIF